jgi:hypothetical protein
MFQKMPRYGRKEDTMAKVLKRKVVTVEADTTLSNAFLKRTVKDAVQDALYDDENEKAKVKQVQVNDVSI